MKHATPLAYTTIATPLGPMLLASSVNGLAGVWFTDQRHRPTAAEVASWRHQTDQPVLTTASSQVARYFAGDEGPFSIPLDLSSGTAFQQSVWQALRRVPRGTTTSYGELARMVGRATAVRAVGAAVGRNPLSVVIPCHRVVGATGSLTGYAGGLGRKAALLQLEGALI